MNALVVWLCLIEPVMLLDRGVDLVALSLLDGCPHTAVPVCSFLDSPRADTFRVYCTDAEGTLLYAGRAAAARST